ncbi:MFS transporter, partial [Streptosporangium algeriense]
SGLLLGPVIIGFVSHATTLRTALFLALALGLLIALAARFLPRLAVPAAVEETRERELSMAA